MDIPKQLNDLIAQGVSEYNFDTDHSNDNGWSEVRDWVFGEISNTKTVYSNKNLSELQADIVSINVFGIRLNAYSFSKYGHTRTSN